MNKHKHNECKHEELAYCAHCDTAYCKSENCSKEWRSMTTLTYSNAFRTDTMPLTGDDFPITLCDNKQHI